MKPRMSDEEFSTWEFFLRESPEVMTLSQRALVIEAKRARGREEQLEKEIDAFKSGIEYHDQKQEDRHLEVLTAVKALREKYDAAIQRAEKAEQHRDAIEQRAREMIDEEATRAKVLESWKNRATRERDAALEQVRVLSAQVETARQWLHSAEKEATELGGDPYKVLAQIRAALAATAKGAKP